MSDSKAPVITVDGPGGSGNTYSLTEVVIKVVQHFFGVCGVLAIAAANSAATLLSFFISGNRHQLLCCNQVLYFII